MKLSSALFFGSLLMMFLTGLILFAGDSTAPMWGQTLFASFFASVFCSVMSAVIDANGH